jgi:hypothetical protein
VEIIPPLFDNYYRLTSNYVSKCRNRYWKTITATFRQALLLPQGGAGRHDLERAKGAREPRIVA